MVTATTPITPALEVEACQFIEDWFIDQQKEKLVA